MRINQRQKTVDIKVVFHGPGLAGKTRTLEQIYDSLQPAQRLSEVIKETATFGDRTIFFDMLPVDGGKLRDYSIKYEVFTVPGQIHYSATRKKVLSGADGVVFVADSQPEMRDSNVAIVQEMRHQLKQMNVDPMQIPLLLQFNKRDLPGVMSVEEMYRDLSRGTGETFIETSALNGTNVLNAFTLITNLIKSYKTAQSTVK